MSEEESFPTAEEISSGEIDLDFVENDPCDNEEDSPDSFQARVLHIRRYMQKHKQRVCEEDKRIGVCEFTSREVEVMGTLALCSVRRRLFRLGIL